MKLKKFTQFSKDLYEVGKEILNSKLPLTFKSKNYSDLNESEVTQKETSQKFEIPTADNPKESSRQQSMLDSQGLPNQPESYGQETKPHQNLDHNMSQRNYQNHQQN